MPGVKRWQWSCNGCTINADVLAGCKNCRGDSANANLADSFQFLVDHIDTLAAEVEPTRAAVEAGRLCPFAHAMLKHALEAMREQRGKMDNPLARLALFLHPRHRTVLKGKDPVAEFNSLMGQVCTPASRNPAHLSLFCQPVQQCTPDL